MRPERSRELRLDRTEDGEQSSRGPTGRFGLLCFLPQGIGLRPQPWAGLSRPVGPVLIGVLRGCRQNKTIVVCSAENRGARNGQGQGRKTGFDSRGAT